MRSMLVFGNALLAVTGIAAAFDEPGNVTNRQAVEEVVAGKRPVANAAWWGFDEDDATDALQAAIRSGAKKVVVPNIGKDWIVRPIRLAGNQELVLEKGVVIVAKRGEYRGGGDSVFTAQDVDNLTIHGDGATIRMQKEDYIVGLVLKDLGWNRWFGQYTKAEWRMGLAIRGCNHVTVNGLTLSDSGGDGLYVDGGKRQRWSSDIRFKGVTCENNYRQGLSVISVDGLVVEDSQFNNTWGTPPSAGIDIEPDSPDHRLTNIVIRNCEFHDNYGDGIEIFLAHQASDSAEVSIQIEKCRIDSRRGPGMRITKLADKGVRGAITIRDCVIENTEAYGIKVQDKSADAARLAFVNCRLRNTARNRSYADGWAPIVLQRRDAKGVDRFGGVSFRDCVIEDQRDRSPVLVSDIPKASSVTGQITVTNPHRAEPRIENPPEGFDLTLKASVPPK